MRLSLLFRLAEKLAFSAFLICLACCACGSGSVADGNKPPAPSCEPTMDWHPRSFDGPVVHVNPQADAPGSGSESHPYGDLQHAIDAAPDGARLVLAPGTYEAVTVEYLDPTCGNCAPDDQRAVPATRGFLVTGKSLSIEGAGTEATYLRTNAGYGLLVEDACEVRIANLSISGGIRDPDGAAADGAVVVRRSRLTLRGVAIRNNTALLPDNGYPGIAGLMLRQGADVLVMESEILNNSWDGVTVFDDGKLRMYGSRVSQGNGVGVGVTWSGRALLVNNEISRYWKGIGSFVDAQVQAYNNTVHHNVGWGVWVTQRARLDLVNNTIAYNDLLGVSLNGAEVSGSFVNNVVAFNGLHRAKAYAEDTFGGRMGVRGAGPDEPSPFSAAYNVVFGNEIHDWVGSDGKTPVNVAEHGTNRAADPKFASEYRLAPDESSALIDAGDPSVLDRDGTRSDVGATGGPWAGAVGP